MVVINCELKSMCRCVCVCVCVCGDSRFHFFLFSFYFNSTSLSLDTIQHIESLSLLFNNNYYLSFIIIILKLSKDSLRGRSVVFHISFILFVSFPSSPTFASLYYFAYSYVSDDPLFPRSLLISVSLCVFLCFALFFSKSFYAFFSF